MYSASFLPLPEAIGTFHLLWWRSEEDAVGRLSGASKALPRKVTVLVGVSERCTTWSHLKVFGFPLFGGFFLYVCLYSMRVDDLMI